MLGSDSDAVWVVSSGGACAHAASFDVDSEISEQCLEVVLCSQAGVGEKARRAFPFGKPAVVEIFEFVSDDERRVCVGKALLEHDEPSDASVSVLERMDALECLMEVEDVFKGFGGFAVVGSQKRTVRSEMPCSSANALIEMYSMNYRQKAGFSSQK